MLMTYQKMFLDGQKMRESVQLPFLGMSDSTLSDLAQRPVSNVLGSAVV